jgi:Zinc finger, C4 type (two domains)
MMHDAETKPDVVNMSSGPLTVSGDLDADVVVKIEPMETGVDGVADHVGGPYTDHIAAAPAVVIKPESPVLHDDSAGQRLVIGSRSGSPAHSVYSGSSDATESADEDGNEDAASGDVVDGQSRFRPDADPAGAYSFEHPLPTATSSVAADGSLSGRSTTGGSRSECRVCGDEASGMYFGALVCVPCKVSDGVLN